MSVWVYQKRAQTPPPFHLPHKSLFDRTSPEPVIRDPRGWWPRYQNYTGGAPGSAIGWPNLGKESLSGRKLPSVESVE